MKWSLNKSKPICPQICEQLCVQIAGGYFKPNQKLLSVREVAISAGVNPNTVQRSFEELEQKGILYSLRGSGWYVSENIDLANKELKNLLNAKTDAFFNEMIGLGLTKEQVKQYVKEWQA